MASQKELMLSPALSALLDNEVKVHLGQYPQAHIIEADRFWQLSRPQTVKRIWAHVHANDLQDPTDKRMIRCDDGMRAVFKQDKVHMFTVRFRFFSTSIAKTKNYICQMNKILSQNMYNIDE